jgi:hypothetical protein
VNEPAVVWLVTDTPSLRPFEGGSAERVDGMPFEAGTVLGAMIGGLETKVAITGGRLRFLVPYGLRGAVQLRIVLDDHTVGVLNLTVEDLVPPTNAVGTVTSIIDADLAEIEEELVRTDALITSGHVGPEVRTDLEEAQTGLLSVRAQFLTLPAADQTIVAAALAAANADLRTVTTSTRPAAPETSARHQLFELASMREKLASFIPKLSVLELSTVIGVATGALYLAGAINPLTAGLVVAAVGYKIAKNWAAVKNDWAELQNECFRPLDMVLASSQLHAAPALDLSLAAGLPQQVPLRFGLGNLQPTDVDDPQPWIADAARAVTAATADSAVLFPNRPLTFAAPRREEVAATDQLDTSIERLEIVDLSDPDVTCSVRYDAPHLSPGLAITCGFAPPTNTVGSVTFRFRYQRWDADGFELTSAAVTLTLDGTCTHYEIASSGGPASGPVEHYVGYVRMCFGAGALLESGEACMYNRATGACARRGAKIWSPGLAPGTGYDDGGPTVAHFEMDLNAYTEHRGSSNGQCLPNGFVYLYVNSQQVMGATCDDVRALSALGPESHWLIQHGLCGGC